MTRLFFTASIALLLTACASEQWVYSAPPGMSEARLERDHEACRDESGMERLREDQQRLEQQCMMDRGYKMSPAKK